MVYKVKLSNRAIKDVNKTVAYLLSYWTKREATLFLDKLEQLIKTISSNPLMFAYYDKTNDIHKAVLTKHNIVYYKVDQNDETIIILTIFNVYQDPEKLRVI